ncbi:MAG: hypothetical protein HY286_18650 [Planctomycetes bacterium]|nr:hypothetical protein [Planctomycetota bacterium]
MFSKFRITTYTATAGLGFAICMLIGNATSQDSTGGNLPYIDLNPDVRNYLSLLNDTIGTQEWYAYGTGIDPQQTGGQPDFGWRQDYKIPDVADPNYLKVAGLILSNAGFRPTYYVVLPGSLRKGYGRPLEWTAEPGVDDPVTTGWYASNGDLLVGHGLQHVSFKHLAALASSEPATEQTLAAQFMMWSMGVMVGGTLRTDYYQTALHSSREVGRVFDFAVDCAKCAWFDDDNAITILDWAKNTVLPSVTSDGIGHIYYPGDQGYHLDPNLGEVPYWYPWQDGLMIAGMNRLGSFLVALFPDGQGDIAYLGAALGAKARFMASKLASVITDDGKCPKAIGLNGNISWSPDDEAVGFGAWCYRALRIANANSKADAVFAKLKDNSDYWPWFVEPDGSWNPNLNMGGK